MLVDINASHATAPCRSEIDGRSAGAAPDFEHVRLLARLHLVREPKPFRSRQPTALPDVLTEGVTPYLRFGAAPEVGVDVVIEVYSLIHLDSSQMI
jgi:hypothetical protein